MPRGRTRHGLFRFLSERRKLVRRRSNCLESEQSWADALDPARPNTDKNCMSKVTAQSVAKEFQQIKDEGYDPDVDEFLRHVPEDMREECRFHIEAQEAAKRASERVVEKEPEAPKMIKLSREEAKAMFAAMEVVATS